MGDDAKMMTLPAKLKTLMGARGLKVKQLANAVGLDVATVSKILNGRSTPRLETLERIAVFFGTTLDALRTSAPQLVSGSSAKAYQRVRSLETRLQAELASGSNPERILDLEIELGQAALELKRTAAAATTARQRKT